MAKLMRVGLLVLVVQFVEGMVLATIEPGEPPEGTTVYEWDGSTFLAGSRHSFMASGTKDLDWNDVMEVNVPDMLQANTPTWIAEEGEFVNGHRGGYVTWDTPPSEQEDFEIVYWVDDLPAVGFADDVRPRKATHIDTVSTIAPYITSVSFTGGHSIDGVSNPVYSGPKNEPACYTRNTKENIAANFANLALFSGDYTISVKAFENGTAYTTTSSASAKYPFISGTVFVESLDNLPNTVGVTEHDFTWKYQVSGGSGDWVVMRDGSTAGDDKTGPHKVYTVFGDPSAPEATPAKNVLGYACTWAAGCSSKKDACDKIVAEFQNKYTYNGSYDCQKLSSSFVRLVASLGIDAKLHKWSKKETPPITGDMYGFFTEDMKLVGSGTAVGHTWGMHQWAQAEGHQYDPTVGSYLHNKGWGDYEDQFIDYYWQHINAIDAEEKDNETGQSDECEGSNHRVYVWWPDTPQLLGDFGIPNQ